MNHMGGVNVAKLASMEQSHMLANTLAQNNDPKFQVCKLCCAIKFMILLFLS